MTEMFMNMRNRSHRCNKNRPRSRHGCKHTTYKKCLIMIILAFPKQHQILRLKEIQGRLKQHCGWLEKQEFLIKKAWNYFHKQATLPMLHQVLKTPLRNTLSSRLLRLETVKKLDPYQRIWGQIDCFLYQLIIGYKWVKRQQCINLGVSPDFLLLPLDMPLLDANY